MRHFLLIALFATAAVPALADPGTADPTRKFGGHAKSQAQSDDDGDTRSDGNRRPAWGGARGGMSDGQNEDNSPRRRMGGVSRVDQGSPDPAPVRGAWRDAPRTEAAGPAPAAAAARPATPRGGFGERLRQYREAHPRVRDGVTPTAGNHVERPTNNSPVRTTFTGQRTHHWTGSWRENRQYDWQQYRRHHRSLFSFGFYTDPYGFGYNRMRTGWSLWPSYFQSSFWLDDPWRYRLPPAYGPYRWVRYWDDALLVDTFTGEVVDVVYDFFW